MNELLWLAMLLLSFGAILLAYRLFGRTGLYVWVAMSGIIANVQVIKAIEIFGITSTLGNIVYATSFLVTDILSENYGRRAATRAVQVGFFSLISMTVLMALALQFTPSPDDFSQESLQTIFGFMPRIVLASLTAYLISQFHDVHAFHFWKRRFPQARFLWVRNNASTMVSQLIDTVIFTAIAFAGVFEGKVFWQIFWTTYILKWLVAAADTPFVYMARRLHESGKITDLEEDVQPATATSDE